MTPDPRPLEAVDRSMRPLERAADLDPEVPEEEDPEGAAPPPLVAPPDAPPPLTLPPLRLSLEWWWDAALDSKTLDISFLLRSSRSVRTEKGTLQTLPSSKRNAMCEGPTTHCETFEFLKWLTTDGGA